MKKVILLSAIAISSALFANAQGQENNKKTDSNIAAKKEAYKQASAKKEHGKTTAAGTNNTGSAKAKKEELNKKDAQKEHGKTSQKSASELSKSAAEKKAELKANDAKKEPKAAK